MGIDKKVKIGYKGNVSVSALGGTLCKTAKNLPRARFFALWKGF